MILFKRKSLGICIFSLWLVILYFCILDSAKGYTLSIGHFPPTRNGHTFLLVTDLSGLGPIVDITFYDDSGREVSAAHKLLPPGGKVQMEVEEYIQDTGTIVLESSNEQIIGEYWQLQENGSVFMLPLQSLGEEKRYFVNCSRIPAFNSNVLVLSDPEGSGPFIQMEFYRKSGELIRVPPKMLRPYGTLVSKVEEYVPWDVLGKVSIRSFSGSVVAHYRQFRKKGSIIAMPARLPDRELLIDRFSVGKGITGNLAITDASGEGPGVEIHFITDDSAFVLEKLLPPNGTMIINPDDYLESDEFKNGVIKVISGSDIIADYWEENAQSIVYTPANNESGNLLSASYFSPLDDTQNLLSLLNLGQEQINVEIQFYSEEGIKLGGKKLLLEPYKRVDELLDYYFGGKLLGTIILRSSGEGLMATSHIISKKGYHLGKTNAQVIK
jgi:hypothetical protein